MPTGGDFVQGLLESGCVVHYPVAYGAVIGLYVSPTGERSDKLFVHPAKEGGLGARGHGIAGGGTVPDPGDLDGVIRARRLGTGRQNDGPAINQQHGVREGQAPAQAVVSCVCRIRDGDGLGKRQRDVRPSEVALGRKQHRRRYVVCHGESCGSSHRRCAGNCEHAIVEHAVLRHGRFESDITAAVRARNRHSVGAPLIENGRGRRRRLDAESGGCPFRDSYILRLFDEDERSGLRIPQHSKEVPGDGWVSVLRFRLTRHSPVHTQDVASVTLCQGLEVVGPASFEVNGERKVRQRTSRIAGHSVVPLPGRATDGRNSRRLEGDLNRVQRTLVFAQEQGALAFSTKIKGIIAGQRWHQIAGESCTGLTRPAGEDFKLVDRVAGVGLVGELRIASQVGQTPAVNARIKPPG